MAAETPPSSLRQAAVAELHFYDPQQAKPQLCAAGIAFRRVKHFRNLPVVFDCVTYLPRMAALPPVLASRRAARVHLPDSTPAVLRCQDGSRVAGNLQVISVAGGMLRLSRPLYPNTRASLMFLSDGGPVLGKAEMLSPLSRTQQAFRFVALDRNYLRNLQRGIQSRLNHCSDEDRWIAKYRSAMIHRAPSRRGALKVVFGSVAFGMLVLIGAACFLHFGLLK